MGIFDKFFYDKDKTNIFFTGQAGYVFRNKDGYTLALDLYLSDCVERDDGFKRLCPKLIAPSEVCADIVVTTHAHYDHFDPDSIPSLLGENTVLCGSLRCKDECEKLGILSDKTQFFSAGDSISIKGFTIHFIPCDHGDAAPDAFGVIIECDNKRFCIAGDTCLRLDRVNEYTKFGSLDVLFVPINGAFGNLNEADAAALANEVKPKLVIPYHYWMFAQHHGDPGKFIIEMDKNCPNIPYKLLCPGEVASF